MPLVPSRVLVLLGLLPAALALGLIADRTLLGPMLVTDLGLLLIAGLDALLAARPLLAVERRVPRVFSIGRPNAVTLELRSRTPRDLTLQVRDDLFDGAEASELPLRVELAGHGRQVVRYHVTPRQRGTFILGAHHLRYRSPLGLWLRQQRITAQDEVRVYPDVQSVRTYELLARQDREASVLRTSRRRGGESEFARLREYRRGDEFRSIDWKATARRQKLISREYQLESNQNVMFLLDAGRLMTAEAAGLSMFDHALNATLMLAHVAARGGDNVGFLSFADRVQVFAPPTGGARSAQRVVQAAYDLHAALCETRYDVAFQKLGLACRKRTLVILFTQILDEVAGQELLRLTRSILPRHLPLLVLFRDSDVEALLDAPATAPASAPAPAPESPARALAGDTELYVRAAAAELTLFRERLVRELKREGALVLDVPTGELTPKLISSYLEIKAQHLL